MNTPDYQCLSNAGKPVPQAQCNFGDPYTGVPIQQTANDTYHQVYGTGEDLTGPFGVADVTVAGLTVRKQNVALVNRGNLLGDRVRSGVFGLAPRAITALYESTNASDTYPDGIPMPYETVLENSKSRPSKTHIQCLLPRLHIEIG